MTENWKRTGRVFDLAPASALPLRVPIVADATMPGEHRLRDMAVTADLVRRAWLAGHPRMPRARSGRLGVWSESLQPQTRYPGWALRSSRPVPSSSS
jgi:hypothetical protein